MRNGNETVNKFDGNILHICDVCMLHMFGVFRCNQFAEAARIYAKQ